MITKEIRGKRKGIFFEPSTTVIKNYLSKTAENNRNIEIAQYALSDTKGEIEISLDENNIGASSIMKNYIQKNTEKVPLIDLDTLFEENHILYVSYIKADIEGAERHMLKGA